MKKTILVVLIMIAVATPCFAQEVEPEGFFSIEGTLWQALSMGVQILPFPSLVSLDWEFGFYGGKKYFFSTATHLSAGGGVLPSYFFILQPIGIGIAIEIVGPYYRRPLYLTVGLLIKIDDNWTPPEDE